MGIVGAIDIADQRRAKPGDCARIDMITRGYLGLGRKPVVFEIDGTIGRSDDDGGRVVDRFLPLGFGIENVVTAIHVLINIGGAGHGDVGQEE